MHPNGNGSPRQFGGTDWPEGKPRGSIVEAGGLRWESEWGNSWEAYPDGYWIKLYPLHNLVDNVRTWGWMMRQPPADKEGRWAAIGHQNDYPTVEDGMEGASKHYISNVLGSQYHDAVQQGLNQQGILKVVNLTNSYSFLTSRHEVPDDLMDLIRTGVHNTVGSDKIINLPESFWIKGRAERDGCWVAQIGHMETGLHNLGCCRITPVRFQSPPLCELWTDGLFETYTMMELGKLMVYGETLRRINQRVADIARCLAWAWMALHKGEEL